VQEIDVRDFIIRNYTPYEGDESFLVDLRIERGNFGEGFRTVKERTGERRVLDVDTIQFQRLRLINLDI